VLFLLVLAFCTK